MKRTPIEQERFLQNIGEQRTKRGHNKTSSKKNQHKNKNKKVHKPRSYYNRWPQLLLPKKFSLADNYGEVISAISRVRTSIGKKLYIDFDAIRQVDNTSALMLAAELEAGRFYSMQSEMVAHNSNWDPKVSDLLKEMGFLELLSINSATPSHTVSTKNQVFIKFRSGHKLIGDDPRQLLESMQKYSTTGMLIPIELRMHLCSGIFEAITNTSHHAHNDNYKHLNDKLNRWWISASINMKKDEIKVVCYDRGATIPVTIRNSDKKWKSIQSFWQDLFSQYSDGEIIHAAMELKRTSTHLEERGKGLPELLRLIDQNNQGILRIYSGMGMAEFAPIKEKKKPKISKLPKKMCGTLVEWSIIPSRSTMETSSNGISH